MKLAIRPDFPTYVCSAFRGVSIARVDSLQVAQVTRKMTASEIAARMVACWNALEGVPMERLEAAAKAIRDE